MQIRISENLKKALGYAKEAAIKYANPEIGTEHLLYGLVCAENSKACRVLLDNGVEKAAFNQIFARGDHVAIIGQPSFTPRVNAVLTQAYNASIHAGEVLTRTEYVLLCLLSDPAGLAYVILTQMFKLDPDKLASSLILSMRGEDGASALKKESDSRLPGELSDLGLDMTARARANKFDPVIGRKDEIERIIQILCRKTKNNPVLIGEPGVGKSAVVEGLAKQIVEGNVPELLRNKIVFSLDMGSLIAGTKYRGAMEEKLKDAINSIKSAQNIIVFIDEIHTLAQAGNKEGEVSPADILKPYLARGELQTIGATTTDEYRKFIEVDKALERRFQPIIVAPPGIEDTIEILKGLKENYESFHKVELTAEAIEAAVKLSDRYITDRFLPDKAIDLIDEAMSRAKVSGNTVPPKAKELQAETDSLEKQMREAISREEFDKAAEIKKRRDSIIKELETFKFDWSRQNERGGKIIAEDIAEIVSKWTKIPVRRLSETEAARLVNLETILHERVIGQDKAIESVAKAIRRARAGLKDPSRPIGSFLFLGPTGVGKTELTRALSEAVFDDENAVIRLDMSEYMESHAVSKLIGSPPGYIGFEEGGQLTEQVRRKPYSVVLFDEIEKAHPDVCNILLQLLDDGRLTDSQGRTVNFKNTIVIMTTNAGVSELKEKRILGFAADNKREEKNTEDILTDALKRRFKPEFLNRIDVITIFHHLSKENLGKIVNIMLNKVKKTLAEKRISLTVTQAMLDFIAVRGYDPEYGARPLRRAVQQFIEDPLAESYINGKVKDGDTVTADYADGKVVIR